MEKLITVLVSVVLSAGLMFVLSPLLADTPIPSLGAVPGSEFYNPVVIADGATVSGSFATTSQGSVTVTAAEFRKWVKSGLVSFSPGLLAGATITLPASSTIPDVLPRAGDRMSFCIQNSTSTANVALTFAGGVGTKLNVASSSATALGSTKLFTGEMGCFNLIREVATSSAFDINAMLEVYQ